MNEQLSRILRHPSTVPTAIGLLSFGAGIGVGYILARRNVYTLSRMHELPTQLEFDYVGVEEFIKQQTRPPQGETLVVDGDVVALDENDVVLEERIEQAPSEIPDEEENPVVHNIFAGSDEEWNYDEEVKNRTSEEPYVLHKDEFYADELGYTQTTLTYYAGDDIMVDEDDSPVYNYALVTGPLKFGHGSGDPNVFHVRNDKRHAEYEILYDSGLYSKEVLGLEIEDNQRVKDLKHSATPRRFRQDD